METPSLLTTGRKIHTLDHQIFLTFSCYFTLNKFQGLLLSKPRQEGSHVHVHMHMPVEKSDTIIQTISLTKVLSKLDQDIYNV